MGVSSLPIPADSPGLAPNTVTLQRCPDIKGFGRATPNPVATSLISTSFQTAIAGPQPCHNWNEISERPPRGDKDTSLRKERVLMGNTGSGQIQEAIREQVTAFECHLSGRKQSAVVWAVGNHQAKGPKD